jgi:aldose 1-epimerase
MTRANRVLRESLAVALAGLLIAAVGASAATARLSQSSHRTPSNHNRAQHLKASHRGSRHQGRANRTGLATQFGPMSVTSIPWGSADGQNVQLFTLSNGSGMKANISNYGGVVQSIWVPDRNGVLTNVALGFPNLSDYVNDFTQGATGTPWPLSGGSGDTFFGAIIGRYANRIGGAAFDLNATTYKLDANNGPNTLHGGYLGWNTVVWTPSTSTGPGSASLTLTHNFPAGEGCLPLLSPGCTGFPAALTATVTYTVTAGNQLKVSYAATNQSTTDATVLNLTQHTYFNLGGEASGSVADQLLAVNSDAYTPVDTNLIPEAPYFVPVGGTAFDFRTIHPIGQNLNATDLPDGTPGPLKQLQIAHGYDHNWVLNGFGAYRLIAVAQDPLNGVTMWTYTDQPGVQLYSSNFLVGDLIGPSGKSYRQTDGFTLETQHYPNSPNHIGDPAWPSVVLEPGATFTSRTAFRFGALAGSLAGKVSFR